MSVYDELKHERDRYGRLTIMARALNAIDDYGCDCGTDEPDSCIACLTREALLAERAVSDGQLNYIKGISEQVEVPDTPKEDVWKTTRAKVYQSCDVMHGNDGRFLDLRGSPIVVAFCGEPHAYEAYFEGGVYRKFTRFSPSSDNLVIRVMINVYVPELKAMKILEGSGKWFKRLCAIRDKLNLDAHLFTVGLSSDWACDPNESEYYMTLAGYIPDKVMAEISHCDRHNLIRIVVEEDW
jgi:hypothetical protein